MPTVRDWWRNRACVLNNLSPVVQSISPVQWSSPANGYTPKNVGILGTKVSPVVQSSIPVHWIETAALALARGSRTTTVTFRMPSSLPSRGRHWAMGLEFSNSATDGLVQKLDSGLWTGLMDWTMDWNLDWVLDWKGPNDDHFQLDWLCLLWRSWWIRRRSRSTFIWIT